jgi:ferredoxin/flavodoxin---NADP+ reductase
MDLYDITIIGGGPTGLFGSFYAGLRGLKTKVIDVLPELGGQLTALYPEKYVYDVAGHPKILAKDLAKNLGTQSQLFKQTLCLGEKVAMIQRAADDSAWQVVTDKTSEHYSKSLLLALGAGACVPKKLDIDYNHDFESNSVFYAVKNKEKFRDKNVLIVGGGDSAVDWANEFSVLAKHVTLIHRRDQFRAVQTSVEEMKRNKVDVKTFYEMKEIKGTDHVESVVIFDNRTGKEETIPVDAITINIGFVINLDFLKTWGLKMDVNAITVNEKMETNLPGVYAAGDIAAHPAKLKLIATGAAEAATAVNFACTYINPSAKVFPGHSSNLNLSI